MRLFKSHGLGNDYLVLPPDPRPEAWSPGPERVALLCDRHRGPGGDGLLVYVEGRRSPHGLRIFNPDGSEAEKSGNGLRIFARFLVDHLGAPASLDIELSGHLIPCRVRGRDVEVEMGTPSFLPADIPMAWPGTEAVNFHLEGVDAAATAVGLGNPHCVFLLEREPDPGLIRELGPLVERHPRFPNRTNVQIAWVLAPDRVRVEIWERGVGETLASGSSACAVVAAGIRTGRLSDEVEVEMRGGLLRVSRSTTGALHLSGPVEEVGEIRLAREFMERLATLPGEDGPGVRGKRESPSSG